MKLHNFRISNFRSFLGEQIINFNFDDKNTNVIYGPNGSGKSNLYIGLTFFRNFIWHSTKFEGQKMNYNYFALSSDNDNKPTKLSAVFSNSDFMYDYGYSLLNGIITDEYLKRKDLGSKSKFEIIFRRGSIDKNRYTEFGFTSETLRKTRPDALVLTKAWEDNNKIATDVFKWLDHFKLINGSSQDQNITAKKILETEGYKEQVLDLLKKADLYIQDVEANQVNLPEELLNELPLRDDFKASIDRTGYEVITSHFVHDTEGKITGIRKLSMNGDESMGTRRIFELAYPLIDTLEKGNILYIDDFEIYLHPKECLFIVSLFEEENNQNGSQLIINTHNTQIINQVGRDNVILFGKNNREETVIGKIPKDIRTTDASIEKKYNKGLFGAVPNIKR